MLFRRKSRLIRQDIRSVVAYWKAYVISGDVEYKRGMELRAIELNNDHYYTSSKMMKRLLEYMSDEEEFWDMMNPKTATELYGKLIGVQRLSLGMPATAPPPETSGNQSLEVHFKREAQRHVNEANESSESNKGDGSSLANGPVVLDAHGNIIDREKNYIERVLSDPSATKTIQEIVIKMQQTA